MKKILLLLVGFILGALAMYYYCCAKGEESQETMAIVKPKGVITPNEARVLDRAFDSRHKLISDSITKRSDNRSSGWSLVDLRNYLNFAEQEADGLGYVMQGVRVYLGAYPDNGDEVGYTTMFFVPTGMPKKSEGNMLNFSLQSGENIPGGSGFNEGSEGDPPGGNYQ